MPYNSHLFQTELTFLCSKFDTIFCFVILSAMDQGYTEIVFVLTMIGFLLIIGIVAVYLFARQWKREHPKTDKEKEQES